MNSSKPGAAQTGHDSERMADHLGIEDRRRTDRRKTVSPWLGVERRKSQRRRNPYFYKSHSK